MNAQMQAQFDKLEFALTTLVDSISTYQPSAAAAVALVEADDDLSHHLETLQTHQSNHTTLVALRAGASSLDQRIASTLKALTTTRDSLLALSPSPAHSSGPQDVQAQEPSLDTSTLLSYAQRISRFTVPPTYRAPLPPPTDTNTTTNNPPPPSHSDLTTSADASATAAAAEDPQAKALATLTPAQRAWLDPEGFAAARGHGPAFLPWPGEEVIRRGGLARIQGARERGLQPEDLPPPPPPPGVADGDAGEAVKREENGEAAPATAVATATATAERARRGRRRSSLVKKEDFMEGLELYRPDE